MAGANQVWRILKPNSADTIRVRLTRPAPRLVQRPGSRDLRENHAPHQGENGSQCLILR